jgi:intein/homing endonuclease
MFCAFLSFMLNFRDYFTSLGERAEVTALKDCYLIRLKGSSRFVKLPKKLTPELSYFVGFFVGDGGLKNENPATTDKRQYQLIVGDHSRAFTLKLITLFYRIFGFAPPLREERIQKGEEFYYINPTSKAVHLFLTTVIGLKSGKGEKFVPKVILAASKPLQKWFLRGYFDAEGSIYKKYKRKRWVISVHAKDGALLKKIQLLLKNVFGVRFPRLYAEKKYYKLFVTHQDDVFKLIGHKIFTHEAKLRKYGTVTQPVF